MKINFILHPGYFKTGTTYIQNNIFVNLKNAINIGKPYDKKNLFTDLNSKLFCKKNNHNLFEQDFLINSYVDLLLKNINKYQKNLVIFSDESLLDFEFYDPNKNFDIIDKIINKLRNHLDISLKIILTLRRQHDLILSRYSYLYPVYMKNHPEIKSFLNKDRLESKDLFTSLKFKKISNMITKKLNSKIKYFLYEDLENNSSNYIESVVKYLEINEKTYFTNLEKINVNSYNGQHFLRNSNIWYKIYNFLYPYYKKYFHLYIKNNSLKDRISKLFYKNIKFSNKTSSLTKLNNEEILMIKKYYSQDNIELEIDNKVNLKKYGYY